MPLPKAVVVSVGPELLYGEYCAALAPALANNAPARSSVVVPSAVRALTAGVPHDSAPIIVAIAGRRGRGKRDDRPAANANAAILFLNISLPPAFWMSQRIAQP